ncbi:MAG: glycosyltransferase family 4 protein [Deltaproteobacteria bacterium]|nr:glycosyltransferase family 4 protein [Deltaproteobacteria bacterium]
MKIALLAHAPEDQLSGGIKTVIRHLQSTFPQLEIFPKVSKPEKFRKRLPWFLNWWINGFIFQKEFLQAHRTKRFDLLFVYPFGSAAMRPRAIDIPIINIYFGCFPEFLKHITTAKKSFRLQAWVTGWLDKRSGKGKHCMTISEPVRKQIKKRYGHDCHVIPVGVDVSLFQPQNKKEARGQLQWDADIPTGLFIGRAEFAKGWDILLQTAKDLPHITFVCVADTAAVENVKNIHILKNISREEMILWHNAADFFIFPSRYESAALVVLEAMACNLPVVISQPVADVCIDEKKILKGVYIVAGEEPEKYRLAIEACLEQQHRAETRDYVIQNRSLEHFKQNFRDWTATLLKK